MRKIMKKILLLFVTCIMLFGCGDSFLSPDDTVYLSEERKAELAKESPESVVMLINADLAGVYNLLYDNGLNGNTRHDYFGLKAIQAATDLTCEDMVQFTHHHFGFDYNIGNKKSTYSRTKLAWALFYKMVSTSNTILADYFTEETEDPGLLAAKAEVLAVRGIAYFYLANIYQLTYKGNEAKPGVPLVLSLEDESMPRGTLEETYAQIILDLKFAVDHGKVTTDRKDADKLVASTFLAKTYAAMENWTEVIKYSEIAIKDVALMDASTYESSFVNISNPEWLWGADINGQTTSLYASFYSHFDNTIPGYTGALSIYKGIHNKLYEKIPEGDVRKKLFKTDASSSAYSELTELSGLKYKSPSDFTGDYCYIRVADPYLLLAEAKAETGDIAGSQNVLSTFVKTRYPDYIATDFSSKEALVNEVRFQRRIELWNEGANLFDMKRWNLPIKRNVEGTNHRVKKDVPAGSYDLVWQIPQSEIESNPNINSGDQNP